MKVVKLTKKCLWVVKGATEEKMKINGKEVTFRRRGQLGLLAIDPEGFKVGDEIPDNLFSFTDRAVRVPELDAAGNPVQGKFITLDAVHVDRV